ncbi:type I methionyl aminopeptidase [Streptomyces sp. ACA25]|uniref:type I methionyl aminopeptidase n=1 Tax=Streptomyces sp. ACA25 TaxID=3022596 RepID=UPI0023077BB6|nr:type I methionyl aminopeptidase [Streptomyces sp. ACA25]MDB1086809.1 type I methionyl aminopeptidase [Streptomyces sp. ACA25]
MTERNTDEALNALHETGRIVAEALAAVRREAEVGVPLHELDDVARKILTEAGAESALLGNSLTARGLPYPATLSTSVNDAIVYGIPDDYRLAEGDLLSVDCGAILDGWAAASAFSMIVGVPGLEDQKLLEVTRTALEEGISAAAPGGRLGDISHAIAETGRSSGYAIPEGIGGHATGRALRDGPPVPNNGLPGSGPDLTPGMVFVISPVFLAGGQGTHVSTENAWTRRSEDGSRSAHFSHTVAVTEDGPRVLTAP